MNHTYKKGVAIFMAVIATSAILLIALAISDIAYKEQIITAAARDSRIAYYAASSGIECALFYDLKGGPEGDFDFPDSAPGLNGDIVCANMSATPHVSGSFFARTTTFFFKLPSPVVACSIVRVTKTFSLGGYVTRIDARGYNNSCASLVPTATPLITDGPRNLERSLEVNYSPD